jgi:hypothetical protein
LCGGDGDDDDDDNNNANYFNKNILQSFQWFANWDIKNETRGANEYLCPGSAGHSSALFVSIFL